MNLDFLDLDLSRPFYEGMNLTVSPYFGMRGLLISQKLQGALFNTIGGVGTFKTLSRGWAIGPNAGVSGNCLLGAGFRFEGYGSASLLYSRYTKLTVHQFSNSTFFFRPLNLIFSFPDYSALRPVGELGIGLGWGSYFDCDSYYLDLSVRYDFLQFWDQNMLRYMITESAVFGDLQLHGITATAQFDF